MTELLSQAYSLGENVYETPNWMRVLIRNTEDPFSYMEAGRTGAINIIDLANMIRSQNIHISHSKTLKRIGME